MYKYLSSQGDRHAVRLPTRVVISLVKFLLKVRIQLVNICIVCQTETSIQLASQTSSISLPYFLYILNGIGEIHCVNGFIMLINEGKSLIGIQIVERLTFSKTELVFSSDVVIRPKGLSCPSRR